MNRSFGLLTLTTAFVKCTLCLLTLTIISSTSTTPFALANPAPLRVPAVKFTPPPPPPNRGTPGSRGQAGSRGCGGNQSLTALMPVYEQPVSLNQGKSIYMTKVWGLTSAENPTFWFSVPYSHSSIKMTEFSLKNEQNQTVYRTLVTIPELPGIVSFRLPSSVTLEVGKNYDWFFKVYVACDLQQQPKKPDYVEGWVQRTNLDAQLGDRLKRATPQQQVALYAENGLWYDALTTLAELRLANPKDPAVFSQWTSLLQSVGLENLANQPLVKCCLPK